MSRYPYDHIDHRVASLRTVRRFYDALMPALGYSKIIAHGTLVEYYSPGKVKPFFGIHQSRGHRASGTRVAFAARSRAAVDRIGALLVAAGARRIEGPADCLDYYQPYYAVFFEDPEGNKLEVCYRG